MVAIFYQGRGIMAHTHTHTHIHLSGYTTVQVAAAEGASSGHGGNSQLAVCIQHVCMQPQYSHLLTSTCAHTHTHTHVHTHTLTHAHTHTHTHTYRAARQPYCM